MRPKIFKTPFGRSMYSICTTEEMYEKFCKRMKIDHVEIPETCDACVVQYDAGGAVLLIFDRDIEEYEAISILVHEATHIWQHYIDHIGELNPGDEFEAYTIQEIFHNVYGEYRRQLSIS